MPESAHKILIVDDEDFQRQHLEAVVERIGQPAVSASSGKEALETLKKEGKSIALMLLDLSMPDMDGIDTLKELRKKHPELPVVVLTAHTSLKNVVEAMRAGATDFISKPASIERIRTAISTSAGKHMLAGEAGAVNRKMGSRSAFSGLVGQSGKLKKAKAYAQKAAHSSVPVLLEGESGVGKELFARSIVTASERHDRPFVTVNCGAIPENLVESILFGHEKGAFTGADKRHEGKFVEASGGTLFLDEIGELPPEAQVKLLRALETGEIDPVGSKKHVKVDIRLISATNRDLREEVQAGRFREDLFYRLNVFPIRIPPLRERPEDIPYLAKYFLTRICMAEGLARKMLSNAALSMLMTYDWPGNVRQLQNTITRAAILSEGEILQPDDFPQLSQTSASGGESARPPEEQQRAGAIPFLDSKGEARKLAEVERDVIERTLHRYEGHMSRVARRLGIGRSTLYRKIDEYGLKPEKGHKKAS